MEGESPSTLEKFFGRKPKPTGLTGAEHALLNNSRSTQEDITRAREAHPKDPKAQTEIDYYDPTSELHQLTMQYAEALKNGNQKLADRLEKKIKKLDKRH